MVNFNKIIYNLDALSFLKKNEDLHLNSSGRFTKITAPDRFLVGLDRPIARFINKGVTFVFKAARALERKWSNQSPDRNIAAINDLVSQILDIDEESPLTPSQRNKITLYVEQYLLKGLNEYRQTLQSGEMWLFPPAKPIRKEYVSQLDRVISRIQNEVLPKMGEGVKNNETTEAVRNEKMAISCLLSYLESDLKLPDELRTEDYFQDVVIEMLESRYGQDAVARALEFYDLSHMHILTGDDIAAVLMGIKANLTLGDLRKCCELMGKELPSEEKCCDLLVKMRGHCIAFDRHAYQHKPYRRQLEKDIKFLSHNDDYRFLQGVKNKDKIAKFSYYEHLARDIAYGLFEHSKQSRFAEGVLFPAYDNKGSAVLKQAHLIFDREGINVALVRPAMPKEGDVAIDLVFRGTHCRESAKRCVSVQHKNVVGPGEQSFERRSQDIFSAIDENLRPFEDRGINLTVSGHSLGASDSLRLAEKYAERLSSGDEKHHINSLHLHCFNTPGIESKRLESFLSNLAKISTPFYIHYFDVKGDPVQQTGYGRLGYCEDIKKWPSNLFVSIFESTSYIRDLNFLGSFANRMRLKGTKIRRVHSSRSTYQKEEGLFGIKLQQRMTNNADDLGITAPTEINGAEQMVKKLKTKLGYKVEKLIDKFEEYKAYFFRNVDALTTKNQ